MHANSTCWSDSSEFFQLSGSHERLRLRWFRLFVRLRSWFSPSKEALDDVKRYRDKEYRESGSRDHPADDSGTQDASSNRT